MILFLHLAFNRFISFASISPMIEYQEYPPSEFLRPYVECYWAMRINQAAPLKKELIIPGGRAEVIFNFNKSLIWHSSSFHPGVLCPVAFLLGQRTSYFHISSRGPVNALGVRLRPGGLSVFTNVPAQYFNNSILPLQEVFGQQASSWTDLLLASPLLIDRITNLENFLTKACKANHDSERTMKLIADVKGSHKESIEALCNLTGFYYKKLERTFKSTTGYTPKNFVRIMRFYKSLLEMKQANTSFTAVSLNAGYYDQSHFIHEFKQFTGVTPSTFASQRALIPDILLRSHYV